MFSRRVSSPSDHAEREADVTAKKIVRLRVPEHAVSFVATRTGGVFRHLEGAPGATAHRRMESPYIARFTRRSPQPGRDGELVQRRSEGQPDVAANVAADIHASTTAGTPLPLSVRRFMEPRFRADFSNVRIHTGERAARLNVGLRAQAFTVGNQIFFGRDRFRPESEEGRELIAHELTHTIQQGGAIQRREEVTVTQRTSEHVQRLGIREAVLDYFADHANNIPGFRMFTIILGTNPITMQSVDRSAANILRAVVEFMPGGALITQALNNHGVFDRAGAWIEGQIASLGLTWGAIRQAIDRFLGSLRRTDILDPGGVWDRARRIFSEPIGRIISFVRGLVSGILRLIKEAVLRPLARLAEGTRAWPLLTAVLGQNPITGEPVPRNAETLIGGFMTLIGQQEIWENIKRGRAVARAWAWFQGALGGLIGFVREIPGRFLQALQALQISDLLDVPRAFARVAGVFGTFVGRFFTWAGNTIWNLLEIIFSVVAPGVMVYLNRARAAFRTILRNPVGFVGNLVRAALMGLRQFASNFLTHLRASLIGWLTGAMTGTGVYIPQGFNLREIVKFVLSVLGLTWQNIRTKLVRVIGETAVRVLETGFDIVVTLVREGPAAAWHKIVEQLTNLRDMVMEQIMTFVRDRVVQAAITRLVTSLNPAGAFIQAVIAIYNTIMFFVERMREIAQVAASVIDSLAAIASGVIAAAANRIEQTMGGLLTLVISFLARIAGLGRVTDAVTNVINRVRGPIDRALDRVVDWIVATARRLGSIFRGRDARSPEEKQQDLNRSVRELQPRLHELFRRGPPGALLRLRMAIWKRQYRLTDLTVQPSGTVVAAINPTAIIDRLVMLPRQQALAAIQATIVQFFTPGRSSPTAETVQRTGPGARERPFIPTEVGGRTQGLRAVLSAPGGAPGETAWQIGTHRGDPVIAIIQRPARPRSPGQGEVYAYDRTGLRRVRLGAYPRSGEVPGGRAAPLSTRQSVATVMSGTFRGSGSRAAGYSEEMAVEGRLGSSLSREEAHIAAAATLLVDLEFVRTSMAAVAIPSAMARTTRGEVPLSETLGGPFAAAGSRRDARLSEHAISRYDPETGIERPPGSADIVPDPYPRGVRDPDRSGSQARAAAQMNMSVDAMAETILVGMLTDNSVLMLNQADMERIRQRTREYLEQRYGRQQ